MAIFLLFLLFLEFPKKGIFRAELWVALPCKLFADLTFWVVVGINWINSGSLDAKFWGFFFFFSFVLLLSSGHLLQSLCFPSAYLRSDCVQLRFVFQRQWHSSLCCDFWLRERSNQQFTWTRWSLSLLGKCLWQDKCMEPPVPGNAFAVMLTWQERKQSKIKIFFFSCSFSVFLIYLSWTASGYCLGFFFVAWDSWVLSKLDFWGRLSRQAVTAL